MARPAAIQPIKRDENFIKILLYGEPGCGKSVFAGTSPKCLILANDDDETSSAADFGSNAYKWVVKDYHDMEEAYEYLRHQGVNEFDWVWIDNATLLQEQGMDQIMTELVAKKPARNRWVPDQHEYLVNQNQLATYIRYIKQLPIHFGVTAHVMRADDSNTGKPVYLPLFQGGQGTLSQKMCGYMGIVGYMYAFKKDGRVHRGILTEKRGMYYAKSRFRGMPAELLEPTVPKMMDLIRKEHPQLGQKATTTRAAATTRKRSA